MTDNSKMHNFQQNIDDCERRFNAFVEIDIQRRHDIYKIHERLAILEQHRNYQIEENRKISKRIDDLEEKQNSEKYNKPGLTWQDVCAVLREGQKAKRPCWCKEAWIYLEGKNISFSYKDDEISILNMNDINADDWVIFE